MPKLDQFSQEMKQNIQEFERILSESSSDPELPPQQLADLREDEANFHMKQSAFLYQLSVQTTPKSLHRLSMRLTVEYFKTSPVDADQSDSLTSPEYVLIFPTLKKIVVLDDDIVVQRDLSELWSLDMGGKVIGALEFCAVKLGAIKSYLGNEKYDANSCTWMSGLNIIDLGQWRKRDITRSYRSLVKQSLDRQGDYNLSIKKIRLRLCYRIEKISDGNPKSRAFYFSVWC
ncbi:probable galacturonosyltransferase 7 isoform X2 [Tanacetum coccineum]